MGYYLRWLKYDSYSKMHVFRCVGLESYTLFKCKEEDICKYFVENKSNIVFNNDSNKDLVYNKEDKYAYSFQKKPLSSDTIPLSVLFKQ